MGQVPKEEMTNVELEDFLIKHDMGNQDFADLLGITRPALDHWLRGRRAIPRTTIKLLKLFDRHPQLMSEF